MRPLFGRARSERGAELVEFAMVVPILLVIIGGIVDFALMLRRTEVVVNAAREGARIAVLPGYNEADVIARVNAYLNEGIEAGASTAASTALNPTTVTVATGPAVQALQVVVQYQTSYPILGPLMNAFGGGGFTSNVTLTARSTMRVEVPGP
jgi:Flp pilus assembly protein TadG